MTEKLEDRLRDYADSFGDLHGTRDLRDMIRQAADRLSSLEGENERLKAAISWVQPPFVDDTTPVGELRTRIRVLLDDVARSDRQALSEPQP